MEDAPASKEVVHKVWKFPLELTAVQTVSLPKRADFRLAADQSGVLTLWFQVDPDAEVEERQIVIVGIGQDVPGGLIYLDSVIQGAYVWHIYLVPTMSDIFLRMAGIL